MSASQELAAALMVPERLKFDSTRPLGRRLLADQRRRNL